MDNDKLLIRIEEDVRCVKEDISEIKGIIFGDVSHRPLISSNENIEAIKQRVDDRFAFLSENIKDIKNMLSDIQENFDLSQIKINLLEQEDRKYRMQFSLFFVVMIVTIICNIVSPSSVANIKEIIYKFSNF